MINPRFVIADHSRAICFIVAENVFPSGKGRGYVLRRLMRRLISASIKLNIDTNDNKYFAELVESISSQYEGVYPQLKESKELAIELLVKENTKYQKAIVRGQKEWDKYLKTI